jgi:hypothetical protein
LETGNQIVVTTGMPARDAAWAARAAPSAEAARTMRPSGWRAISWRMLSTSCCASKPACAPMNL